MHTVNLIRRLNLSYANTCFLWKILLYCFRSIRVVSGFVLKLQTRFYHYFSLLDKIAILFAQIPLAHLSKYSNSRNNSHGKMSGFTFKSSSCLVSTKGPAARGSRRMTPMFQWMFFSRRTLQVWVSLQARGRRTVFTGFS